MIRFPFAPAARLPPFAGDAASWTAPWLVALMVYIAGLAGIGLILIDETLRASENPLAGRLTIQVPADASAARIETILAVLRQTSGIRSVRLLTPSETGRLLEEWLGSPVPLAELPVPRLIDVGLDSAAAIDIARLGAQLGAVVPEIRIDDYRPVVGGLRARVWPAQALLAAAIGGALLLVAASAAFATGAALAARRSEIELLHLLGADDRQIARLCTARSLVHALIGGGIGTAALLATVAALGGTGQLIRLAAPVEGIGLGDRRLWAVLAAIVVAAGILAAASARVMTRRRLARLP
jgi:cell division transport system permease protein